MTQWSISGHYCSLQHRPPVDDDVDRLGLGAAHFAVNQERLTVCGDVVVDDARRFPIEQHSGCARVETRAGGDRHRHQPLTDDIEQLLAVTAPAWLHSAAARNAMCFSRSRKWPDVDVCLT